MEIQIVNNYNQRMSYNFIVNLPITTIKNFIWHSTFKEFETEGKRNSIGEQRNYILNSFRFQPAYLSLNIISGENSYPVEYSYAVFNDGSKTIKLDDKYMDNNHVWIKGKRIKIPDNPVKIIKNNFYIHERAEEIGVLINNCSYMFSSAVDFCEISLRESGNFPKLSQLEEMGWVNIDSISYNEIKNYFANDLSLMSRYMLLTKKFNQQELMYMEKYQKYTNLYKKYKNDSPDYLIDSEITFTKHILCESDIDNPYVDLYNIFKYFITSSTVPFLSFRHDSQNKIKLDTGFSNKELIKKWSVTDDDLKSFKDLNFKVKIDNAYCDVILSENGRVKVSYGSSRDLSVYNNTPKELIKLINDINKIKLGFFNFPSKLIIKKKIDYINFTFNMSNTLSRQELERFVATNTIIRNLYFSDLAVMVPTTDTSIKIITKTIKQTSTNSGTAKDYGFFLNEHQLFDESVITIRKSNSYDDSSLVTISNGSSYNIYIQCMDFISSLLYFMKKPYGEKKTISDKNINKNKALKSISESFNPTDCQKGRQPTIDPSKEPRKGSYSLTFKNQRLLCDYDDYKYPGFTINGNVCCFKKDQRNTDKFKKFSETENNFLVRPTNIPYLITKESPPKQYPIIMYNDKLFYIKSKEMILLPEKVADKVMALEKKYSLEDKTIFLQAVPYYRLISLPPKSINAFIQFDKDNNLVTIDKRHHFGFNIKGYPFNFETIPEKKFNKTFNITMSSHIIKTQKILQQNRLGVIPEPVEKLLSSLEDKEFKFYRVGTIQNNNAFINSVAKATNNKNLIGKIKSNIDKSIFLSLENGEVAPFFNNSITSFKTFLSNDSQLKTHDFVWDICEIILGINIIIIEHINSSYNLLCKKRAAALNISKKIVFVYKNGINYEPLLCVSNEGVNRDIYLSTSDDIFKAYNYLCDPITNIPPISEIKNQIIDVQSPDKIKYIVMNDNFISPLKKKIGPIPKVNIVNIAQVLVPASQMLKISKNRNVIISSQILDRKESSYIVALLTSNNDVIPVKRSKLIPELPISKNYVYFPEADMEYSKIPVEDKRVKFIKNRLNIEEEYHNLLYRTSKFIKQKNISLLPAQDIVNMLIKDLNPSMLNDKKWNIYAKERLLYDLVNNVSVKNGTIKEKYGGIETPNNQIIITEISRLNEYLKSLTDD